MITIVNIIILSHFNSIFINIIIKKGSWKTFISLSIFADKGPQIADKLTFFSANAVAGAIILFLFFVGWFLDRYFWRKITIQVMALLGILIALCVIATNVIGYSRIFGFQIQLGNFLIFFSGMILGPLAGALVGLLSDLTGLIISGGVPHFGFTLVKVMYGFLGAMVFLTKHNKKMYFIISIFWFMLVSVILHLLVFTPLSFASYGGNIATKQGLVLASMLRRLILVPVEWVLYSLLVIACFEVTWIVLKDNAKLSHQLWCSRHGTPKFLFERRQISKVEKVEIATKKLDKKEKVNNK
ncbi:folate family ECF transporter S component [Mycoplasma putrefaciens]|uniref:Folate ECF transporter S component FolT n=1 Tax=Mycoplasma putrefaciens (strain ATCC 15718 / NCTC 10155 / C30 KS-1 / KS-1) TaxID=743965 RepID=A0A7U3ZS08_MYCPK|nr:folate family ECF transporter S component [Mycoplasma putrefaciens]AEM68465.1 uncharacterized protein MPUT_0058 [Mycoplasma putrefaciens KS1]